MPWSTRIAVAGGLFAVFFVPQTAPAQGGLPPAKVVLTLRAGPQCLPGPNLIERFRACAQSEATVTIREKQKVVGRAVLDMTQQYKLAATKPEFGEKVTFKVKRVEGRAQGARITLAASCAGTCTTAVKMPADGVEGQRGRGQHHAHRLHDETQYCHRRLQRLSVAAAAATPGKRHSGGPRSSAVTRRSAPRQAV